MKLTNLFGGLVAVFGLVFLFLFHEAWPEIVAGAFIIVIGGYFLDNDKMDEFLHTTLPFLPFGKKDK